MIVGIDNISPGLSTSKKTIGGMRGYLADLTEGLPLANPDLDFILFTPDWADPLPIELPANCRIVTCDVPRNRAARVAYEQTILPGVIRKAGVELWLGTCNALPPSRGWSSAVIIQSLQCFTQEEAYGYVRRTYLQRIARAAARRADAIVALSHVGKKQILDTLEAPAEKVAVIHHWLPRSFRQRTAETNGGAGKSDPPPGITSPYILCVSAFYGYKNIPRLVRAFASIRHLRPGVSLVLAGSETPELSYAEVRALIQQLGVEGSVVLAGRVEDRYMPGLYRGALAVAMPSLEETFGLPILEALHYGRPVVTSLDSPMAEVAGSAGLLVDPMDETSIAQALLKVILDSELRAKLSERAGIEAGRFAYDASIGKFSNLLREMGSRAARAS